MSRNAQNDHLTRLEQTSIHVFREAFANFRSVCMPWSMGKDSNVLIWLARKAFCGKIPFPLLHIDTTYEFPEMYEFREKAKVIHGIDLDIRADRIKPLVNWVNECFPGVDTRRVEPWAGLRPMMPNMLPRVGAGKKANVFYNTGHGHLGWTLSAITAHQLAGHVMQSHGTQARSFVSSTTPALSAR